MPHFSMMLENNRRIISNDGQLSKLVAAQPVSGPSCPHRHHFRGRLPSRPRRYVGNTILAGIKVVQQKSVKRQKPAGYPPHVMGFSVPIRSSSQPRRARSCHKMGNWASSVVVDATEKSEYDRHKVSQ